MELSAVINDPSISYSVTDPVEPRAITPAQFPRGGHRRDHQLLTSSLIPSVQGVPPEADRPRELLRKRTNHFYSLSRRWHREYILQLQLQTANLDNAGRPRPLLHPGLDGRV